MRLDPATIAKGPSESAQQKALFAWVAAEIHANPNSPLALLYAIPNGGAREAITGARMKAEGARAGVLDIHWPYPCGRFASLYIEMKYGDGKLSELQAEFAARVQQHHNAVAVCWTYAQARWALHQYATGALVTLAELP